MKKIELIFVSILVYQLVKVDAAITYVNKGCGNSDFNYTHGSVFERNLNLLLENLSSKSTTLKFYNSTVGEASDKVYGLFQCRNDLGIDVCNGCIEDATKRITQRCPFYGEAVVWYYECMLRYSNQNIFSKQVALPSASQWSTSNITDYDLFAPVLVKAMNDVIQRAASGSPHFAWSENHVSPLIKLYTFAQCTPDIDTFGCNSCLKNGLSEMSNCCSRREMVAIFLPSCQLKYDTSPFIRPETTIDEGSPKKSMKPAIVAAIAVASVVGLILLSVGVWLCLRRRKPKKTPSGVQEDKTKTVKIDGGSIGDVEFVQYDFADLKVATREFSADHMLGEGGFGIVYKATLGNGEQLAVKRLSDNSGQGTKEFMTEARLVAKLQHKNLVRLVGFCSEGNEKLLVYEFMPNSSLEKFLFDAKKRMQLNWPILCKIVMGIARGLQYLHEDSRLKIIHRDLKPSNILLDKDMNPKIADFGMAKLFGVEQTLGNTSRIVGTHGYMAPEYMMTGEYSDKSDVYSFGIIVLEIVSGQRNRMLYQSPQREDLPSLAWRLWNEGRSIDLADATLSHNCSESEVMRCIQIGLLCAQALPEHRPAMSLVVHMLTGSVDLPVPSAPAMSPQPFSMPLSYSGGHHSTDRDKSSTVSSTLQPHVDEDLYPRPR